MPCYYLLQREREMWGKESDEKYGAKIAMRNVEQRE
jgi:hypothetical protein